LGNAAYPADLGGDLQELIPLWLCSFVAPRQSPARGDKVSVRGENAWTV